VNPVPRATLWARPQGRTESNKKRNADGRPKSNATWSDAKKWGGEDRYDLKRDNGRLQGTRGGQRSAIIDYLRDESHGGQVRKRLDELGGLKEGVTPGRIVHALNRNARNLLNRSEGPEVKFEMVYNWGREEGGKWGVSSRRLSLKTKKDTSILSDSADISRRKRPAEKPKHPRWTISRKKRKKGRRETIKSAGISRKTIGRTPPARVRDKYGITCPPAHGKSSTIEAKRRSKETNHVASFERTVRGTGETAKRPD